MSNEIQLPDYIIRQIYNIIKNMPTNIDIFNLYKEFYKSKYENKDFFLKECKLHDELIEIEEQYSNDIFRFRINNEYEWIKIYPNQIGEIKYRYYMAPNPDNLHEIVESLTTSFLENDAPVKFKYQLEEKMTDCDRVIIYSDTQNKPLVEKTLLQIYQNKENLFKDSERALPWLYESIIPNIYIAPETPGFSYGIKFADTLIKLKQIINRYPNDTDYEIIKPIIVTLLKANGILFENSEVHEHDISESKKR